MPPVVVLHVDSLRREYPSAWMLARRFKQAGCRVILTSRISTIPLLRFFTPDVLVLSHPFSLPVALLDQVLSRGVQVYVNEAEGALEDEAAISSTYPAGFTDYSRFAGVFVWNTWSREWLAVNRRMDPSRIHPVGSIRNVLIEHMRSRPAAHTVGILSRFEIVNTFDGRHAFQNLLTVDPEDDRQRWYFDRCAIDAEAFAIVAKLIGRVTACGVPVSIRPHPNENVSSYRLLCDRFGPLVTIDASYDLTEWLSRVSVVVGPTSTAYTEAYLARIPIVTTEKIQRCHYTSTARTQVMDAFSQAAHLPATVVEAEAMCLDPALEPKTSVALDRYLAAFYQSDTESDPIGTIVGVVTANARAAAPTAARSAIGLLLKGLIDCASLGRAVLRRHPIQTLVTMRQYHYNSVLHRPNAYMKSADERIVSVDS
jgi:surface carbohydrate biosynthesis protein